MELTKDEIKLIRKALQCVSLAHDVIETADETNYRDTAIDALIRKFREAEDGNEGNGSI